MGYVFENICFKHVNLIRKALNLEESSLASPWRYVPKKNSSSENGAQIDLLFERNDDAITLCEIKYTDKQFVIDKQYCEKLKSKIDVFKKIARVSKQLFFVLISANGLKNTSYSEELVRGVVTIDDLFKK